jgi:putative hemolysin
MADKFIDVEKVLQEKNPRLLKRLPKFVINYLKRILHQDEINQIIEENKDLEGADFCHEIISRFQIQTDIHGLEHAPKEGGVIFVANHPLGGMDALTLVHHFAAYRPDMKFIVNDILLHLKNLNGLFVGVNKHGSNAVSSLQNVEALFASDKAIFVFPAGLVSRKIKGQVRDLKWKKTFVTRARKYEHPIVPVYIRGRLSNFFYRLSSLRQFLGLKTNIEMLYLVNELFKQKNKRIDITFGKPILVWELDANVSDAEWADRIKARVYDLA